MHKPYYSQRKSVEKTDIVPLRTAVFNLHMCYVENNNIDHLIQEFEQIKQTSNTQNYTINCLIKRGEELCNLLQ